MLIEVTHAKPMNEINELIFQFNNPMGHILQLQLRQHTHYVDLVKRSLTEKLLSCRIPCRQPGLLMATFKSKYMTHTDLRSACFLRTAPYLAYHRPISRPFRCGGGRSRCPPPVRSWSKSELCPLEPPPLSHLSLLPSLGPRPPLLPLLPPPPPYP